MALSPTPENFRAEMSRHGLRRQEVCSIIHMNRNLFSQFVCGTKPLRGWAAHNIGMGINMSTGIRLIDVDEDLGIMSPPKSGRAPHWNRPSRMDPTRRPAREWRRATRGH